MKIAIVNDLPMALETLRRSIALTPRHEVIWTATNGAQAVSLCAENTPDLVLMDLIMPGMDGVEATRQIMEKSPCAIVVVTASVGANSWRVFEAMGHGALDAVDTPEFGVSEPRVAAKALLHKIDTISRLIGDYHPRVDVPLLSRKAEGNQLIVIGASSGGPTALAKLLGSLTPETQTPIIIVQHIDEQFSAGMASWLSRYASRPVRLAQKLDQPAMGDILLAGTSDHLVFRKNMCLDYTVEPVEHINRPSIDVFFDSVRNYWNGEVYAILLTGMGRDGAVSLKALRDNGHYTVAQDEATSAVYGMPKAAAELNAAVDILPLSGIAKRLIEVVSDKSWKNDNAANHFFSGKGKAL